MTGAPAMSGNETTAAHLEARNGLPTRAFNPAIATLVENILRIARGTLRRPDPVWFDLNDHFLADIEVTRAEAEAARCLRRTPLGAIADGVIRHDLAKPRLPSSRLE